MQWGWGPARHLTRQRAVGMALAVAVPMAAGGALATALTSTVAPRVHPFAVVDRLTGSPGTTVPLASPLPPASQVPPASPAAADPLADPAANLVPVPAFPEPPGPCWSRGGLPSFSQPACVAAEVRATDHARVEEGLPAMTLPGDYASLTPQEQLFVLTDLERVSRGLAPVLGLSTVLDRDAQQGASDNADPGFTVMATLRTTQGGVSNWGASMSPLDVDYYWMYLDGWGGSAGQTFNVDCPAPGAAGCWAHRDNILVPGQFVVMGAGYSPDNWNGYNSYTEVVVTLRSPGDAPPLYYTWAQAVAAGAAG